MDFARYYWRREFPHCSRDRGYARRRSIRRATSSSGCSPPARRRRAAPPLQPRPRRRHRARRGADRQRRQGRRRRGQHQADPSSCCCGCCTARSRPNSASPRTSGGRCRCCSTRPTTCSRPSVATMLAEGRSAGLEAVLRLAVLGPDPRRDRALRCPLAAAVDLDLPHARDGRRPVPRRPGDGHLQRPHLDRPRRPGTAALLRRRHHPPPVHHRHQPLGRRRHPRPAFVAGTLPWEELYDEQLAEHHLAAQRERGGHHPATLPDPLGDKRPRTPSASDSARRRRPSATGRTGARPAATPRTAQIPRAASSLLVKHSRSSIAMLPDSYTAAHRYDGAIIQRQRSDDPQPARCASATSPSSATSGATTSSPPASYANSGGPDSRSSGAPPARQALPRRPSRALPPLTRRGSYPMDLLQLSAAGHRCSATWASSTPAALQAPRRLRLRPTSYTTSRSTPGCSPTAARSAWRPARVAWRAPTHPAPDGTPSCASTTTGPSKASATRNHAPSSPTPFSRSPQRRRRQPPALPDRVRPHQPRRQELRQVPPLRRLPHLVVAPHRPGRPRRAALGAVRLPGRGPARRLPRLR